MAISKDKVGIQISLYRSTNQFLEDVVNRSKKTKKRVTKSNIIEAALSVYWKYLGSLLEEQTEKSVKEEN